MRTETLRRVGKISLLACVFTGLIWSVSAVLMVTHTVRTPGNAIRISGVGPGGLFRFETDAHGWDQITGWVVRRSNPAPLAKRVEWLFLTHVRLRADSLEVPFWMIFALFSSFAGVAFALVRVVEHRIDWRRKLGLCPACGYDLRGSPAICPECGEPSSCRPAAA